MKKHKSVVAILLAVMMVFVMMPSMAFATVTWGDDYKTATTDVENHVPLGVEIIFDGSADGATGTGVLDAKTTNANADVYGGSGNVTTDCDKHATFFDLNGATLKAPGAKTIPASMTKADFDALTSAELWVVEPSYAKGYTAGAAKKAKAGTVSLADKAESTLGRWTFTTSVSGYDPKVTDKDQDVTISFKKTSNTATGDDVLGTIAQLSIKVTGTADSYKTAVAVVDDGKDQTKTLAGWEYDGADHSINIAKAGNAVVAYYLWDENAGKFVSAPALTFKNAGSYVWYATATDPAKKENVTRFPATGGNTTTVRPAAAASFGFDKDGNAGNYAYDIAVGEEFDPWDNVIVAKKDAPAAAANEALIKEYAKDFYTIDAETTKATPNITKYTLRAKNEKEDGFTEDAAKALREGKYKELLANMAAPAPVDGAKVAYANFLTSRDYEVEFTKTITAKTYKGSKTTSKGKLKKNQSFTVKAAAANGATVNYKLINANPKIVINKTTGKVTVKKGLTKGTYKIKVKAYVPEVTDGTYACEVQAITIKVKK
jgi:hypothetical protein